MARKQLGTAPLSDVDAVRKADLDAASNAFAATIGNGSATTIAVTHNLGTLDVVVSVYRLSTGAEVDCDVTKTDGNTITLTFATAPATNSLRVTVIGTAWGTGSPTPTESVSITDATTTGRALLTAAGPADARDAIGLSGVVLVSHNVEDYGVDLSGVTTSDTSFQAALTAASTAAAAGSGIVEVYVPPGTVSLTSRPTVGAGVIIKGAGRSLTKITSSHVYGVLSLTGASDITIADLTIESTASGSTDIGVAGTYTAGVQRNVTITNCRITGTNNNAVRFATAVENLRFTDNIVDDCALGFSLYAPSLASGLLSTNLLFSHNSFRNVGSVNLGLYGGTNPGTISTIHGVEIVGNDLRDFAQTGAAGPIPIEPTMITNIRIANNTIIGPATRGISTGNNVNMTITGNTITDQSIYAFELNGGKQITIVGNVTENCATFAAQTNDPAVTVDLSDVVIADNTYIGSGRTSSYTADAISITTGRRVRISNNIFKDWQYLRGAIRVGNGSVAVAQDCVVDGNTFVATDANTPIVSVLVRTALRTNVTNNVIRINRDLVAGEDATSVITVVQDAASDDTLIDSNHIQFSGAIAAAPSLSGIGNGLAGAAACPGLTVSRNYVVNGPKGIRLVTNSADCAVYDNYTYTCATTDTIPATAQIGPRVGSLLDTNGKTVLSALPIASAANYLTVRNHSTGNAPQIAAAGSDDNINLQIIPKGAAYLFLGNGLQLFSTASAVNILRVVSGQTGTGATLAATGGDTNVDMLLTTKGTGIVKANGSPVGVKVAVPASATATGVPGQWAADNSWIYVCTAANTWVRAALASW